MCGVGVWISIDLGIWMVGGEVVHPTGMNASSSRSHRHRLRPIIMHPSNTNAPDAPRAPPFLVRRRGIELPLCVVGVSRVGVIEVAYVRVCLIQSIQIHPNELPSPTEAPTR